MRTTDPADRAAQLAWAAGLYEGEGYCGIAPNGYPRVGLGMTDEAVVRRFAAVLGCGSIYVQRRQGVKPMYRWETTGWVHAAAIREAFASWLGTRRLSRFDLVLSRRPHVPTSVPCDAPSAAGHRRHLRQGEPSCDPCREAHRDSERTRTGARPRQLRRI